jgi:hypothetical protein
MTPADAITIVAILDEVIRGRRGATLFPNGKDGDLSNLGILWVKQVEALDDAELATRAAVLLFTDTNEVPTPSDYRDAVRKVREDLRMKTPAIQEAEFKRELEPWVKGWTVARYRDDDMRVWPQQRGGYDRIQRDEPWTRAHVWADQEMMPEDEQRHYEQIASPLTAEQIVGLILSKGTS